MKSNTAPIPGPTTRATLWLMAATAGRDLLAAPGGYREMRCTTCGHGQTFSADLVHRGRAATLNKRPLTAQYIRWRKAVLRRDQNTCQECGATSGLVAHHVKHWRFHPALRFTVSNGQTLCHPCHAKKHPHLIKWTK